MKPEVLTRLTTIERRLRDLRYALEDAVGPVETRVPAPSVVRSRKDPDAS